MRKTSARSKAKERIIDPLLLESVDELPSFWSCFPMTFITSKRLISEKQQAIAWAAQDCVMFTWHSLKNVPRMVIIRSCPGPTTITMRRAFILFRYHSRDLRNTSLFASGSFFDFIVAFMTSDIVESSFLAAPVWDAVFIAAVLVIYAHDTQRQAALALHEFWRTLADNSAADDFAAIVCNLTLLSQVRARRWTADSFGARPERLPRIWPTIASECHVRWPDSCFQLDTPFKLTFSTHRMK